MEKERRRIMDGYEEHASRYRKILGLSREARELAAEKRMDAGRILVDEYDQPIAEGAAQGGKLPLEGQRE